MQLSQLEPIIKQQSEQIGAQQLQTESMNMRMSKFLDTLGPMPIPIVQTATAVMPPTTEVKFTAPLSAFCIRQCIQTCRAQPGHMGNYWTRRQCTGRCIRSSNGHHRSQVPNSPADKSCTRQMQAEGHLGRILREMTMTPKGVMDRGEKRRTSVGRSTLRGADAHREVGLGMEMMMGTGTEVGQMTVTADLSGE